jgi:DNA-binding NtrC family response regulator
VEHAHGGTLFLDEIGDMPLATQAKLLRVLQNQEVLRVGSLTPRKVNVRVIAATNRSLRQSIADKQFREDLYYRLSMVEIDVPSLAERKEDLPLLERHFLSRFASQYGKQIHALTHRAQITLALHSWPGNVRELENVIGHACMMTLGDTIDIQDLPPYLHEGASPISGGEAGTQRSPMHDAGFASSAGSGAAVSSSASSPVSSLEDQERILIARALQAAAGNQSEAARILRIGRDALRYKLKKHGL